jgi:hypothetical protein
MIGHILGLDLVSTTERWSLQDTMMNQALLVGADRKTGQAVI